MIIYPKAKINLGLKVVGKRDDGFHNLESLFVSVPHCTDILEIVESDKLSISLYGSPLDCEPGMNICEKAFDLLANDFDIPGAEIHLYKNIPSGAGLGGGSSDGACTLILLNSLYDLGLDTASLLKYASVLGSDCPYFILAHEEICNPHKIIGNPHEGLDNTHENSNNEYSPVLVTGKGDILERYPLDSLNDLEIRIVSPNIFISTADAFAGIVPRKSLAHHSTTHSDHGVDHSDLGTTSSYLKEILQMPAHQWKGLLINDFERHIFLRHPQLAEQKALLYQQGAIYASMTGSGSSLFGLFSSSIK